MQIVADILDGYFWVGGRSRSSCFGLVGREVVPSLVQVLFFCEGPVALATKNWSGG